MREQKISRAQDLIARFVRLNPCVSGYAKAEAWHGGKSLPVSSGGSALIQWDDLGANPKAHLYVELTRVEWPILDRNKMWTCWDWVRAPWPGDHLCPLGASLPTNSPRLHAVIDALCAY